LFYIKFFLAFPFLLTHPHIKFSGIALKLKLTLLIIKTENFTGPNEVLLVLGRRTCAHRGECVSVLGLGRLYFPPPPIYTLPINILF
jgi:hypothetical protein